MLIEKITTGYVIQVFDTETKTFTSQRFVAGDEVTYQADGQNIVPDQINVSENELYHSFEMQQPDH